MKTVVLQAPRNLRLIDTPLPSPPGPNEAQVRIRRVGICGTDLHAFQGVQPFFSYPRILGHELSLEVLSTGLTTTNSNINVGDLCCLRPYLNCGTCSACRRGYENCCMQMQVLGVHRDGGMREIINVPLDKLHTSTTLLEEDLAMVEMLSIGYHAARRAHIIPGEVALVVGMGPIGLGVAFFAHLAGARVMAAEISDTRLAFASGQSGIEHVIDAKKDVLEQLSAILHNDLPTVVFNSTGNAQSMMKSFGYVAHGGRLVFPGLVQGDLSFSDPEFHRRELSVLASRNATADDFRQVISALENHKAEVRTWITHRVSPEQLITDFPSWLDVRQGVIKAMVSF